MTQTPSSRPADAPAEGSRFRERIPRPAVLRKLLSLYDQPRYLEVGVNRAKTFDKLDAPRKVAVDPLFQFDHTAPERQVPGTDYHQVTSDEYFATLVGPEEQFDVIYLDGLHTYDQTLRDLMNALHHLQPRGVIVIDDVRPPTYLASISDRQRFFEVRDWMQSTDQRWMGDVYKLMLFIDTFCPHLDFATIANNHGQGVIWRHRRTAVTHRTAAQVAGTTFEELVLDEAALRLDPFGRIVPRLRRDLGL